MSTLVFQFSCAFKIRTIKEMRSWHAILLWTSSKLLNWALEAFFATPWLTFYEEILTAPRWASLWNRLNENKSTSDFLLTSFCMEWWRSDCHLSLRLKKYWFLKSNLHFSISSIFINQIIMIKFQKEVIESKASGDPK